LNLSFGHSKKWVFDYTHFAPRHPTSGPDTDSRPDVNEC
jgi:hypothetical protein